MISPEAIARHEAAHAVAALMLGCPVRRMELTPQGGVTELAPFDRGDGRAVRKALLILAAGDAVDRQGGWR